MFKNSFIFPTSPFIKSHPLIKKKNSIDQNHEKLD